MRKKRKTVRKKRSGCTKVILLMVLIAAVIVCVRGIDAGKSAEQIVQNMRTDITYICLNIRTR